MGRRCRKRLENISENDSARTEGDKPRARFANAIYHVPSYHFALVLLLRSGQRDARILIGNGHQLLAAFGTWSRV